MLILYMEEHRLQKVKSKITQLGNGWNLGLPHYNLHAHNCFQGPFIKIKQ